VRDLPSTHPSARPRPWSLACWLSALLTAAFLLEASTKNTVRKKGKEGKKGIQDKDSKISALSIFD